MFVAASAPLTAWLPLVCCISWQCFHYYVLYKELGGFGTSNWFWHLQVFSWIYILLYRSSASFSCLAASMAKSSLPGERCILLPKLCSFMFRHGACNRKGTNYTWERANFVEGRESTFLCFWTLQFCCQALLSVNEGDNYNTLKKKAMQTNYRSI